jgi:very-long-chain (3R)-3-hydroxyacyl-CoA dehydratase
MSSEIKAETSNANNKANKKTKRGLNSYLIFYNATSWVGWTYVLVASVLDLIENDGDVTKLYDRIGWTLTLVQTGAILEVLLKLFYINF